MSIKNIKTVIIAFLIGCFLSFPVVAENSGLQARASNLVIAVKTGAEPKVAGETNPSVLEQAPTQGRHATSESPFELFSLQGMLSLVLLLAFFLVFIKGKILKVD
ncbi:MAG: hypothetical protein ACU85E_11780 [Gammaproteobacteria bacterium]